MEIPEALTFDDVLLVPAESKIMPSDAELSTQLTKDLSLKIPVLSAAMDTVTESRMAIAMAQVGGMGVIHKNLDVGEQADEVRKVKKFESGMVINPVTVSPDKTLADALHLMNDHQISGIPVVQDKTKKLVGILTNRDVRFATNRAEKVSSLMTKENLITVKDGIDMEEAKQLLHKYRIEKLLVVDENYKCIGLVTVKDIEKAQRHPDANKDEKGRLRVAAATGVGDAGIERADALIAAEADVIIVDTAHGHSFGVQEVVSQIKKKSNSIQLIAGNIATAEGAKALIGSGADAVKIGIGPGSICTTRVVAGVGVPQFTAIIESSEECHKHGVPAIADGGIKYPGDLAKAIAGGADCAMIGSILAGTDEAPGEVFLYQGRSYKSYRGMGSLGAMARGSADRYFQQEVSDTRKLIPEGIEGQVPYKGPVGNIIHQLVGGLRASMGYTGNATILEMQKNTRFVRSSEAGRRESHVHDVTITREAPNYRKED